MAEPWFNPNLYAWIPGASVGVIGGILGAAVGSLAPRGKLRRLVVGMQIGLIAVCVVMLIVGVYAWIAGQPYGIWYGFGLAGLLGVTVIGSLLPTTLRAYRQAELRKSQAHDL